MNGPTAVETWALSPEQVTRLGFSSDQAAALNDVVAGECTPLHAARVLRSVVLELLPPFAQPPDNTHVRQLSGLLLLCGEAFKPVDDAVVPPEQAAIVGHRARGDADGQVRAMRLLLDHKTPDIAGDTPCVSRRKRAAREALRAKKVLRDIRRVLNVVAEERRRKNKSDYAAKIWEKPDWSKWQVFSWIACRNQSQIGRIEDRRGLGFALKAYDALEVHDKAPEVTLLAALKHDKLRAIKDGKVLEPTYWFGKDWIEDHVSFRREDVLKHWRELSSVSTSSTGPCAEPSAFEVRQAGDVQDDPLLLKTTLDKLVLPPKSRGRRRKESVTATEKLKDILRTMSFPKYYDLTKVEQAEMLQVSRPTADKAMRAVLSDPEFQHLKELVPALNDESRQH